MENWLADILRDEPDPARRSRLLCAFMVKSRHVDLPWFDSGVNNRLYLARTYLQQAAPASVERFEQRLEAAKVDPALHARTVPQFLPQAEFGALQAAVAALAPVDLRAGELASLGRYKLNNAPIFAAAFDRARQLVERETGRSVRPVYSMFIRYGATGRLPVHLDSLDSQLSVGLCLNRAASWPIHCSKVVASPLDVDLGNWSADAVRVDPAQDWRSCDPAPNEAIFFAPAHQWHCRDPIGAGHSGPYDMVYFSFVDPAAYDLLFPDSWAEGFGIPELAELATVLALFKQHAAAG